MSDLIRIEIPNISNVIIELDENFSPNTVKQFLIKLPFSVELNVWGEEIYTNESPIDISEENAKSSVSLNDVAYWPTGKPCVFFLDLLQLVKMELLLLLLLLTSLGKSFLLTNLF